MGRQKTFGGFRSRLFPAFALLFALGGGSCALAWDGNIRAGLPGETDRDDFANRLVDEFLDEDKVSDLGNLRDSHLSNPAHWRFAKPDRPGAGQAAGTPHRWQAGKNGVTPLGPDPITTLIQVAASGEYRISVRQELSLRAERPVTLSLQPMRTKPESGLKPEEAHEAAGEPLRHSFGRIAISPSVPGGKQEARIPVRFESAHQLVALPSDPVILWEYWDAPLAEGIYEMSLAAPDSRVRVSAVFLSRSKDFRPSLSAISSDNTFNSLHVRFRLLDPQPARDTYSFRGGLTYHWPRKVKGSAQPVWGWGVDSVSGVPPDQWSPFINVTEAVIPGPGPWSTWKVGASGLRSGRLLVQSAWMAHEAAVMHEFETAIGSDGTMIRYPNGAAPSGTEPSRPAWGIWDVRHFAGVMTEESMIQRYLEWAIASEQRLGLKEDHPRSHRIRFSAGCGVSQVYRESAADMLARLGINWINGAPASIVAK